MIQPALMTASSDARRYARPTHEPTVAPHAADVTWPWNGRTFNRLPKIAQPNKTFYDKGQLESGIRYGYIPDCAHTDGDLYVHFPQQNVLAVGDVI